MGEVKKNDKMKFQWQPSEKCAPQKDTGPNRWLEWEAEWVMVGKGGTQHCIYNKLELYNLDSKAWMRTVKLKKQLAASNIILQFILIWNKFHSHNFEICLNFRVHGRLSHLFLCCVCVCVCQIIKSVWNRNLIPRFNGRGRMEMGGRETHF